MNWINNINAVIKYIEDNLDKDIDEEEISKIASCSIHQFNRVFSYITNISLVDYIRYRRLSLSAFDIIFGNERVIDMAVKYGYTSNATFSRAYKKFHGVSPKKSKNNGTILNIYARLDIDNFIYKNSLYTYKLVIKTDFSLIGYKFEVDKRNSYISIPKIWRNLKKDCKIKQLSKISSSNPEKFYGVFSSEDKLSPDTFDYYVAVENKSFEEKNDLNEKSLHQLDFKESYWAVFFVEDLGKISDFWDFIFNDWLSISSFDINDMPYFELYSNDKSNHNTEIWIPIKRRNGDKNVENK